MLFGGATALLPIYARDILHVGPVGLGVLRSAPAVGAAVTALVADLPAADPPDRPDDVPRRRRLRARRPSSSACRPASTLSLAALVVLGACDMVSVFVRQTLVQIATPDAMRGRVSAVNSVFIGASNELGEFESGVAAAWFGTVPAVVIGGLGTLLVAMLWARWFPALRDRDRLVS